MDNFSEIHIHNSGCFFVVRSGTCWVGFNNEETVIVFAAVIFKYVCLITQVFNCIVVNHKGDAAIIQVNGIDLLQVNR